MGLDKLYTDQLSDLYNAETQLVEALPALAQAASEPILRQAFENHLVETQGHIARLEEIFQALDQTPGEKVCKAMKGLIAEGKEIIEEETSPEVRDAGLIAAAQRVEHYEIAGYGCVRTYAKALGDYKAAQLLQTTLDEEALTDEKLTSIAEQVVNRSALAATA
jgi:ferritin-like metal-binding protein YciE